MGLIGIGSHREGGRFAVPGSAAIHHRGCALLLGFLSCIATPPVDASLAFDDDRPQVRTPLAAPDSPPEAAEAIAAPDSLTRTAIDSLAPSPLSQLSLGPLCRWRARAGVEIEGLEQTLGDTALFIGEAPPYGTPGEVIESLRLRERETDLMGLARLELQSPWGSRWQPSLSLEAKAGEQRRVFAADGRLAINEGRARGLTLENMFLWDEQEEDGRSTGQELVYARWKRRLGESPWALTLRSRFDLSWAAGDSLADLFDYRRAALRIGLEGTGLESHSYGVEIGHKWVDEGETGAYDAIAFDGSRGWYDASGTLDLDGRVERRAYLEAAAGDDTTGTASTLGSYWEAELYGRWHRTWRSLALESTTHISGTLYDEEGDQVWTLSTYDDRFRAELACVLSKTLVGGLAGSDPWAEAEPAGLIEGLELGLGPVGDLLRLKGGQGDYDAVGGRFELRLQGDRQLGELWIDLAAEIGRRDYRADGGALVFDYQGLSFSLSQTDYTYYEVSAIGGGKLPFSLEWEAYFSLDQERHSDPADNGRLLSFSVALLRTWCLGR